MRLVGALVAVLAATTGACGSRGHDAARPAAPGARPASSRDAPAGLVSIAEPWLEPIPASAAPGGAPIAIRVVATAAEPAVLDTSFGVSQPFAAASLDRSLGHLRLDAPFDSSWPRQCACPCDPAARCARCEPPALRRQEIAPGAEWRFEWNGRMRRSRTDSDGDSCFDTFAPAPGRYVIRACAGTTCGRAEVTLPAREPIVVRLGQDVRRDACPLPADLAERAARSLVADMLAQRIVADRLRACEIAVECVPAATLDARERAARARGTGACTVLVVPRGDKLDVRLIAPLPEGSNGGDVFSHEMDPDAAAVLAAHYTQ